MSAPACSRRDPRRAAKSGGEFDPLVPRAGTALDGGGDERIQVQLLHHKLQHAQNRLARALVGGDDVAGERIGGLAQTRLEGCADQAPGVRQALILTEQGDRRFGCRIPGSRR